ncbi:hypothetical protein C2E20_3672 [Micractinium conductrix]|uniref:AP2/ERF domain-containing protein n=1 Tax=Micractinium conductrix TaxID=554055 RepID=A0A2P6VG18_9CHLO|nr:hypothetical protein C2E20_3672 [Micractinium conductrix]|eukprot:PSC73019.1 hypothetical protein C2E20_3672 [Micractinium conductrix]
MAAPPPVPKAAPPLGESKWAKGVTAGARGQTWSMSFQIRGKRHALSVRCGSQGEAAVAYDLCAVWSHKAKGNNPLGCSSYNFPLAFYPVPLLEQLLAPAQDWEGVKALVTQLAAAGALAQLVPFSGAGPSHALLDAEAWRPQPGLSVRVNARGLHFFRGSWQCIPLQDVNSFGSVGRFLAVAYSRPARGASTYTFFCCTAGAVHAELRAAAAQRSSLGLPAPADLGSRVALPPGAPALAAQWAKHGGSEGEEEEEAEEARELLAAAEGQQGDVEPSREDLELFVQFADTARSLTPPSPAALAGGAAASRDDAAAAAAAAAEAGAPDVSSRGSNSSGGASPAPPGSPVQPTAGDAGGAQRQCSGIPQLAAAARRGDAAAAASLPGTAPAAAQRSPAPDALDAEPSSSQSSRLGGAAGGTQAGGGATKRPAPSERPSGMAGPALAAGQHQAVLAPSPPKRQRQQQGAAAPQPPVQPGAQPAPAAAAALQQRLLGIRPVALTPQLVAALRVQQEIAMKQAAAAAKQTGGGAGSATPAGGAAAAAAPRPAGGLRPVAVLPMALPARPGAAPLAGLPPALQQQLAAMQAVMASGRMHPGGWAPAMHQAAAMAAAQHQATQRQAAQRQEKQAAQRQVVQQQMALHVTELAKRQPKPPPGQVQPQPKAEKPAPAPQRKHPPPPEQLAVAPKPQQGPAELPAAPLEQQQQQQQQQQARKDEELQPTQLPALAEKMPKEQQPDDGQQSCDGQQPGNRQQPGDGQQPGDRQQPGGAQSQPPAQLVQPPAEPTGVAESELLLAEHRQQELRQVLLRMITLNTKLLQQDQQQQQPAAPPGQAGEQPAAPPAHQEQPAEQPAAQHDSYQGASRA